MTKRIGLFIFSFFLLVASAVAEHGPVGDVIAVRGKVFATNVTGAVKRTLKRHSEFYVGEIIVTKDNSAAQLNLIDGTIISLRPNTKYAVNEFILDKNNPSKNRYVGKLMEGVLISMSGQGQNSTNKNHYLRTPAVTAAIKGAFYSAGFGVGSEQDGQSTTKRRLELTSAKTRSDSIRATDSRGKVELKQPVADSAASHKTISDSRQIKSQDSRYVNPEAKSSDTKTTDTKKENSAQAESGSSATKETSSNAEAVSDIAKKGLTNVEVEKKITEAAGSLKAHAVKRGIITDSTITSSAATLPEVDVRSIDAQKVITDSSLRDVSLREKVVELSGAAGFPVSSSSAATDNSVGIGWFQVADGKVDIITKNTAFTLDAADPISSACVYVASGYLGAGGEFVADINKAVDINQTDNQQMQKVIVNLASTFKVDDKMINSVMDYFYAGNISSSQDYLKDLSWIPWNSVPEIPGIRDSIDRARKLIEGFVWPH